jgi:hypothetical protein
MAEEISATDKADARVITPPKVHARILIHGVPAWLNTIPGFRNIPEPMIMPMTIAIASIKVTDFFNEVVPIADSDPFSFCKNKWNFLIYLWPFYRIDSIKYMNNNNIPDLIILYIA